MEDFNALAAALGAGILDVRGCLILSSDGLVLGAHPESAEVEARSARIKLAAVGEPERGFLQFGTEVWCYVRRGPYAALAVTGKAVRPGLVIDQMEQALLRAEESRSRREGVRPDGGSPLAPAPTTKPRTPLHPDTRPAEEPIVVHADPPAAVAERSASAERAATDTGAATPARGAEDAPPPPRSEPSTTPAEAANPTPAEAANPPDDVDRFSLAREFSRLLQDDESSADG